MGDDRPASVARPACDPTQEHHVLRDSITRAERLRSLLGVLVVVP
jgi:hypothetical protein